MILADKITELRKKRGWSQEELAEKVDVTRQSVSKWESAQSTPDLDKILKYLMCLIWDMAVVCSLDINTQYVRIIDM